MAPDILGRPKVGKRIRCRETQALKRNVSSLVYDALHTPGQPLDPATRTFFEYHFHRDFSRVRVHTDECAAASACVTNTVAYTVGNHIVFGEGQYAPWTPEGTTLLAHELTHVVQQGQTAPVPLELFPFTTPGDAFEREANECARTIVARAAADPCQELRVMCKTDGPVLQGWWIDEQAPPGIHGRTHQLITRTVVNETEFAGWFHAECKEFLVEGSADPDRTKAVGRFGRPPGETASSVMYHGWGARSEEEYPQYIEAFVLRAVTHLNKESQEADRRRLSVESDRECLRRRGCLRQGLRHWLGIALHAAQDKAAHGGAQPNLTSEEMDNPSKNLAGWPVAFDNTRSVLRRFHVDLNETSKLWVRNGPPPLPELYLPADRRRF